MKKQLLFKFKILKKLKAFSLFILIFMASVNLNAQNAMGWTGTTDTAFLTATNWANTLVGWGTSDITINAATNNPVLNTAVPGTGSFI